MAVFRYKALSPTGSLMEGEIEAPSETMVIERLQDLGYVPIRARTVGGAGAGGLSLSLTLTPGLGAGGLMLLTRQMATLLAAGLPVDRALELLAGLADSKAAARVVQGVLERVKGGAALADALAEDPAFPRSYVALVRAGEAGGALEPVFARLADLMERQKALRDEVVSALLAAMAAASVAVLMTVVVPRFEPLFAEAGAALPLSTRLVVGAADLAGRWGWLPFLALLLLVLGWPALMRRPGLRLRLDRQLLGLPVLGGLLARIETARFARTLGTLLGGGVPMLPALAIVQQTLGNQAMAGAVAELSGHLKEGRALAGPLAASGLFPSLAVQLVRVGEESGRLEEMLLRLADIAEAEVKTALNRLLAMLVPGLTITVGLLVAGIIGSILAAVLSVYDLPI